jgi:hypothetical protein
MEQTTRGLVPGYSGVHNVQNVPNLYLTIYRKTEVKKTKVKGSQMTVVASFINFADIKKQTNRQK